MGKIRPLRIGADIGGTYVRLLLVSVGGEILARSRFPAVKGAPYEVLDEIATQVNRWHAEHPEVNMLGVACAGWVDVGGRVIHNSIYLGWKDVAIAAYLEDVCDLPVKIENDVNAAILGEMAVGAAVGKNDCVAVFIGTGVGGGIVANGHLVRGTKGAAAEIGHQCLDAGGPSCTCGRKGCWEAYSGGVGLTMRAYASLKEGARSCLAAKPEVTPSAIVEAAKAGDTLAASLWREARRRNVQGVANLALLLDPEVIVIGGGVVAANPEIVAEIREGLEREPRFSGLEGLQVVRARLGDDAACLGIALAGAEETR
jgi:glucokinase